ncbi:MAG: hypothetical protein Q8P77_02610 [Candidatus Veblenbacteria bacterium]|nr:hypothetical protein [Candidatus Veblenbacteria bacterium]
MAYRQAEIQNPTMPVGKNRSNKMKKGWIIAIIILGLMTAFNTFVTVGTTTMSIPGVDWVKFIQNTSDSNDSIHAAQIEMLRDEIYYNDDFSGSNIDYIESELEELDTTTMKIQPTPVAEVGEGEEETVEAEQPESTGEVIVPDSQEVKNPVKKISKRKSIFK